MAVKILNSRRIFLKYRAFLILFMLIIGIMVLSFCNPRGEFQEYLNHADDVQYVGIKVCSECHADKLNTFSHTGMGQSFGPANSQKSKALFGPEHVVYDSIQGLYYYPFWRNKKLFFREFRIEDQDTTHKIEVEIDFIIGSGQHTNSHIYSSGDFTFQAPITYYVQGERWDLAPGFENGNNTRFNRILDVECMSCHNSMPSMSENSQYAFQSIGAGIDCERCHGPGELHVQAHEEGRANSKFDPTIVNPRDLDWKLQIDICQRCHLQGLNLLQEGRKFTDFKPGMPLDETFEIFLPFFKGQDSDFDMANHAARFQKSACFTHNQKRDYEFTCISCHNPHVSIQHTQTELFNTVCQNCHKNEDCNEQETERSRVKDNCVYCHMPNQGTGDIPHVSVHDHYIRKPIKNADSEGIKTLAGLYAVNSLEPKPERMLQAYLEYFEKFDKNPFFLQKAAKYLEEVDRPLLEIKYYYLLQDYKKVIEIYTEESPSLDHWSAYLLAESYYQLGMYDDCLIYFRISHRLLDGDPVVNRRFFMLGVALNFTTEAGKLLLNLKDIYLYDEELINAFAVFYLQTGDLNSAQEQISRANLLNPHDLKIWETNLNLFIRLDNKEEIKHWANKILSAYPDHLNKDELNSLISKN